MSGQSPTYPRNVFSVLDVTINSVLYGTSRFDIPGHESNVSASFDARDPNKRKNAGDTSSKIRPMWNKKKSLNSVDPGTLAWLAGSQAGQSPKIAGILSYANSAKRAAILPEEPLVSEVQTLLNSATRVIECATGGHGRCANRVCRCQCHKSMARSRSKRRISLGTPRTFEIIAPTF